MANNNQLFDAALTGFLNGVSQQRQLTAAVAANYASYVNAGVAFANQVDSLIALDASLVTPTTSETVAKVNLLGGICAGVMANRFATSTTQADYATLASAVVALYTQGIASLLLP